MEAEFEWAEGLQKQQEKGSLQTPKGRQLLSIGGAGPSMELSRHWLMMSPMIRLLVFYGALCLLTVSSSMTSQPAALQTDPPASRQEIESFWRATLQRAAKEPLEAEVEPVKEPLPYQKFRVTYRSLDGIRIRAYLGVPIRGEGPQQKLPGIVTAPGYGGSQQGVMLEDCQRGYAVLQVYPRSQGESADLWKIDGPDKLTWRVDQPEGSYYQGAYVDVTRGLDYLLSRADIDASRVGAMGTSQGGGIVLAVAALDSRVKAVAAHVPFLCDMRRAALIPGALVKTLLERRGALNARTLRTLDYFDPVNLAEWLRAPVLLSSGGQDAVCPPETIRSVFDRLPGIKSIVVYPALPHTSSGDFYRMGWEWMDRHLGR
jgi:cephalosporin-C deacetylase